MPPLDSKCEESVSKQLQLALFSCKGRGFSGDETRPEGVFGEEAHDSPGFLQRENPQGIAMMFPTRAVRYQ